MSDSAAPSVHPEHLLHLLQKSVHEVRCLQPELWTLKSNERTIAAQLFLVLAQSHWPDGYVVDFDWSSKGSDQQLMRKPRHNREGSSRAIPDIVVHRRGQNGPSDNLLIIEIKRGGGYGRGAQSDIGKLKDMMGHLGYLTGAVVALGGLTRRTPPMIWWFDRSFGPELEPLPVEVNLDFQRGAAQ